MVAGGNEATLNKGCCAAPALTMEDNMIDSNVIQTLCIHAIFLIGLDCVVHGLRKTFWRLGKKIPPLGVRMCFYMGWICFLILSLLN